MEYTTQTHGSDTMTKNQAISQMTCEQWFQDGYKVNPMISIEEAIVFENRAATDAEVILDQAELKLWIESFYGEQ